MSDEVLLLGLLWAMLLIGIFAPGPNGDRLQFWWAIFFVGMAILGAEWDKTGLHQEGGRIINAAVWAGFAYSWARFRGKTNRAVDPPTAS